MFGNATTTVDPHEIHIQSVEHLLEQVLADSRAQALRCAHLRHEYVDPHERSNPCAVKRSMTAQNPSFGLLLGSSPIPRVGTSGS